MRRADRTAGVLMHGTARSYSGLQIALHWVSALLLVSLVSLGYYMTSLAKGAPGKAALVNLHKSLGLTAALVIAWRVIVRTRQPAPPSIPGLHCWETELARITHRLLYMCMVVMPLSGYLGSSFNQYGTRFWGVPLPRWGWVDNALQHLFYTLHGMTAYLLLGLVVLHVAGVIKHQWFDARRCVQRMLPGRGERAL
ncbi:cytochrome b [Ralstonia soli]|uniref:Cytochrome b/b6 domain-containing protein n=1 Tax=Ralstonia soli TaxID=2953896 RepID=A0ABT1ATD3_9RALS|nr:cytochrome b/b6 domain-containing protein [Ralstonia soli]MCO5401744.1 cytochrome b/b6 domain-containing protein [Ralstonia soli]